MGIHTRVIAMCRNRERAETRFGDYRNDPDLELMIQDVTEPVHVDGPVDFCIHAASPAGIFSRQEMCIRDRAEEAYEKAIAAMPRQLVSGDQRSAVTFLNLIRIRDQKDLPEEQVVTLYEQATAREDLGKDADFEYFLAWWYLKRGRRLEALPYLTRAVEKLERYGTFGRALYAAAALQQIYEQTAVCQRAAGNLSLIHI